jgi:hypothetical protein
MSDLTEELNDAIDRRARRASAILLSFKETNCDKFLPDDVCFSLRKVILDEVNELAELSMDCVKRAESESGISNDYFVSMLEDIHNNTEFMKASLEIGE